MNVLAFDNPWEIIGLIAVIVVLRLAVSYIQAIGKHRASVLEFIDAALFAVVMVFCILRPFVVQAFFIPSGSMLDTLQIHDRILVNKFIYFFREPEAGDVVVFDAPRQASQAKKDFIKRVVGVPGDRISIHNHRLHRNGIPIEEPYVRDTIFYEWPTDFEYVVLQPGGEPIDVVENGEIIVPQGYLLVMGDNRNDSNDSHRWMAQDASGTYRDAPFLPRENVLGKAICIFWPPTRISLIRSYPHTELRTAYTKLAPDG